MTAAWIGDAAVSGAMEHCRRVTRRCARNFYYGLKLAPEPKRSALYAIYAWMRAADDLVDDASPGAAGGVADHLRTFGERTERALAGKVAGGDGPTFIALAHVARTWPLDPAHFREMLRGQATDAGARTFERFDDLREYCYRVASTVGLICITVWGYRDEAARALAVDRGIAFQLTNILRDYSEDFDAGRVYLPQEDFRRHGLTPRSLREWSDGTACERFWSEQSERAQSFYDRSRGLEELISEDCRPVLWAMTAIYAGLLDKARRMPRRAVVGPRIRLSAWRKGLIAIEARRLKPGGLAGASA